MKIKDPFKNYFYIQLLLKNYFNILLFFKK